MSPQIGFEITDVTVVPETAMNKSKSNSQVSFYELSHLAQSYLTYKIGKETIYFSNWRIWSTITLNFPFTNLKTDPYDRQADVFRLD